MMLNSADDFLPELAKMVEMTVEAIGKISLTGIKKDNGG